MDTSKLDEIAQYFTFIITEDALSFYSDSPFKNVAVGSFFILLKEFLLFNLHVCDICIFGFWGAGIRKELMQIIVKQIAKRMNDSRENMLDGMLNNVRIDNIGDYFKKLDVSNEESFVNDFNKVQKEYSNYTLTKEFDEEFEGKLEWEFGKKMANLAGHKGEAPYITSVTIRALAFFKLTMETIKTVDEKYKNCA